MVRRRVVNGLSAERGSVWLVTIVLGLLGVMGDGVKAADFEYKLVENWAQLPPGETLGGISGVTVDRNGQIHVFRRDFPAAGNIWTLDSNGKFLRAWGDKVTRTHALRADKEGNFWITDVNGHQVKKYRADGTVALTLGKLNTPGDGKDTFDQPSDVLVGQNGDIFVTDGYGNSRVLRFNKDGKYIKEWGTLGSGPGQFNLPHQIVQDSSGRLLVGDRSNGRIQLFDIEGKYLGQWTHLGAPFGMDINKDDTLVVGDFGGTTSVSGSPGHIAIADARTGKELYRIKGFTHTHDVAIDPAGNIFVGSNSDGDGNIRGLKKFVKTVKPPKT
jgi:sugar lactone lactonase YvrE